MTSPIQEREKAMWAVAAAGWARHDDRMTGATGIVTQRMLDAAGVGPGMRVLDLASGTGNPAIPAALRVGATGFVLATNLTDEMLSVARTKAMKLALRNIEIRTVEGEAVDVPPDSFDAVTFRWGIMFVADAAAVLRHAHAALRAGGKLALTTWAGPERNSWIELPRTVLARFVEVPPMPVGAHGMYAYADPERLRAELAGAGFRDIVIEEVAVSPSGNFASGAAFVDFLFELGGTFAQLAASLLPDRLGELRAALAQEVEAASSGNNVRLPGVTWLASATK